MLVHPKMKISNSMIWSTLCSFALITRSVADSLVWGKCYSVDPPLLQCAQLEVPIDWSNPRNGNTTIGVMRLQSPDPSQRIGSLFFNPGGPGFPATNFVARHANRTTIFSNDTIHHFDIIAPDPRGVGLSSRVVCGPDIYNEHVSYFPTTEPEFERLVDWSKRFGRSCLNLTGPLLQFVDTESFVRDMEAVRIALGEGKMNYLGTSYGTMIGSQYAELFPDNIRLMALDSNVDHAQSETNMFVAEGSTAEDEFKRFAQYCGNEEPTCALYGKNFTALWNQLVDQANASPIPAPGCAQSGNCRLNVTGEDLLFGLEPQEEQKFSNHGSSWVDFGQRLSEAIAGEATNLSMAWYTATDHPDFAAMATMCLDWTSGANTLARLLHRQQLARDYFAPNARDASETYQYQAACIGWPLPVQNPPHRMDIQTNATILMVAGEHDSENSFVWSNSLYDQISNAVMITRRGDRSATYYAQGEGTKIIDDYLAFRTLLPSSTFVDT